MSVGPIVNNNTYSPRVGFQRAVKDGETLTDAKGRLQSVRDRALVDQRVIPGTDQWHVEESNGVTYVGWSIELVKEEGDK